ncbi:LacI family DNA-binding transcriptional regulator [Microbacterium sp. Se63.02b]|uniref:LacI family DNA-binding transcriptional regulator n=1 Tax=Microbacterium sp. Se63.02b TaxID=2709304 RepID=UPI001604C966|nr:LacI family DNA-binding transcriptional regulator [Microbacterium sp. Se63.02b]QNA93876.1 LacI family transcriptional regulator [Microbacterium sp. Se63.02b]
MPKQDAQEQPARAATRTDVARLAGVSTAVVSYVVNNGPRPVAASTRTRVLAAMDELDYRPNAVARALRMRSAQAVGLVVPDVSNTYFGALARELSVQAFTAGYALLLGDADNDIDRERAQVESLVSHQIDGLVIVSLDPASVAETGTTPTVFLDQRSRPGQLGHRGRPRRRRHGRLASDRSRTYTDRSAERPARRPRGLGARTGMAAGTRSRRPADRRRPDRAERILPRRRIRGGAGSALPRRTTGCRVRDLRCAGAGPARRSAPTPPRRPERSRGGLVRRHRGCRVQRPPLTAIEQPIHRIAETALAAVLEKGLEHSPLTIPVDLVVRDSCGCGAERR